MSALRSFLATRCRGADSIKQVQNLLYNPRERSLAWKSIVCTESVEGRYVVNPPVECHDLRLRIESMFTLSLSLSSSSDSDSEGDVVPPTDVKTLVRGASDFQTTAECCTTLADLWYDHKETLGANPGTGHVKQSS